MGPKAPKDPTKKRPFFYIMRGKNVAGSPAEGGKGVQFLFMSDGRLLSNAKIVGGIEDESMIELLKTVQGFRKLVHSIGIEANAENKDGHIDFVFQMYGKEDVYGGGTSLKQRVATNGMEHILPLEQVEWSEQDNVPGQIRIHFEKAGELAEITVKLYLNDGFEAPEQEEEANVDLQDPFYQQMLKDSLVELGNTKRFKTALAKARAGEKVTFGFIGGSITQGAGAVPINTQCYAYKTFQAFCKLAGKGTEENIQYVKAGVGGTPSELGLMRYEMDVLNYGEVTPDIMVVEYAVNDAGDETEGDCYDSLIRKIYNGPGKPAVILLFSVFADDYNLQERMIPIGKAYDLPMVSVKNAVTPQFYLKPGEGKVIGKGQFFYDCYHPANVGHTIMADCLNYYMEMADTSMEPDKESDIAGTKAPKSGEFETVRFVDRKTMPKCMNLQEGDFKQTDTQLQYVERNLDLGGTPEFPNNWMHAGDCGDKALEFDVKASALFLVYKDSGDVNAGEAIVLVDGKEVLRVNPREVGWTHCNALICFRNREEKLCHVEVKMAPGHETKDFTILGFGYVSKDN